MEKRAKVPTKILSIFLSVLMALSCVYVALPSLAPEAKAAEVSAAQWSTLTNALTAAFNAGVLGANGRPGVSVDGTTYTVTDNTYNGYIFDVVRAVGEIALAAGTSEQAHNILLADYIIEQAEAKLGAELHNNQKAFIRDILPMPGAEYEELYPGHAGSYYDTSALPAGYTFTVKVTRDAKAAVIADYTSAAEVPSQVVTSYEVVYTAQLFTEPNPELDDAVLAYYKNTGITASTVKSDVPNYSTITAIKEFREFVDSNSFQAGYQAYLNNNESIYGQIYDDIYERNETYHAKLIAANHDDDYVEAFITAAYIEKLNAYYNAGQNALTTVDLKKYVDWINGLPIGKIGETETINKLDYTEYDYGRMNALVVQAQGFLNTINTSGLVNNLVTYYEYDTAAYPAYISEMQGKIEKMKAYYYVNAANALMSSTADEDHPYTFPVDSPFGNITPTADTAPQEGKVYYTLNKGTPTAVAEPVAADIATYYEANPDRYVAVGNMSYRSQDYIEAGEECPLTYASLVRTSDLFGTMTTYFDTYDYTVEGASEMRSALLEEIAYRKFGDGENNNGTVNQTEVEFAEMYQYFNDLKLNTTVSTASTSKLQELIKEAEANYVTFNARFTTLKNQSGMNANVVSRYQAFVNSSMDYIKSMYRELLDRVYKGAFRLYDDAGRVYTGANINSSNASVIKADISNIDDDISTDAVENDLFNWIFVDNADNRVISGQSNETSFTNRLGSLSLTYSSANGSYTMNKSRTQSIYNAVPAENGYLAKINQLLATIWTNFSPNHYDNYGGNNTGTYTVRKVMGDDIARDTSPTQDYVLNKARVNAMITGIDGFFSDKNFTQLVGAYKEGEVENLNDYIEQVLNKYVFSDKMVNTLVGLIFPKLTSLIEGLIKDLFNPQKSMLPEGWVTSPNMDNAAGAIDVTKIAVNDNLQFSEGKLNIWIDGKTYPGGPGTSTLPDLFESLGLYLYPQSLRKILNNNLTAAEKSAYSDFLTALQNAGRNWSYFNTQNRYLANGTEREGYNDYDSDGNPIIDGKDFQAYVWNVSEFQGFAHIMGIFFTAAIDVLRTIFTNDTFSHDVSNLAAAYGTNVTVKAKLKNMIDGWYAGLLGDGWYVAHINWIRATPSLRGNSANTGLSISGVQGYNNVWIPIMEALGLQGKLTAANNHKQQSNGKFLYDWEHPFSSTLGSSGRNCTGPELVYGLFFPLYALIHKIAQNPIQELCKLLPNVAYNIAYGRIEPLLKELKLSLGLNLDLTLSTDDIGDINIEGEGSWWSEFVAWLADKLVPLFKSPIVNKVNDLFPLDLSDKIPDINVGEMLDLKSQFGLDLSNLNSLLGLITDALGADIDLEPINALYLGQLGTRTIRSGSVRTKAQTNGPSSVSSSYNSSHYYYVQADTADVFVHFFNYLFDLLSGDGFITTLLGAFGVDLGTMSGSIDSLLSDLDPMGAIAALCEILVPNTDSSGKSVYNLMAFDWYIPNAIATAQVPASGGRVYGALSQSNFVYLRYANDWTRVKAETIYNDLEDVLTQVLQKFAPQLLGDYEDVGEWLDSTINSMFNNEGVMNVVDLFAAMGNAIAGTPILVRMLRDQIKVKHGNATPIDGGIDILAWYKEWGYNYPDYYNPEIDEEPDELLHVPKQKIITITNSSLVADGQVGRYIVEVCDEGLNGSASNTEGYYKNEDGQYNVKKLLPSRPGETGYPTTSAFPNINLGNIRSADDGETLSGQEALTCDTSITLTSNTAAFVDGKVAGDVVDLVDGGENARAIFAAAFCTLAEPFAPLFALLFTGDTLQLFKSLSLLGYEAYEGAVLPLMEALGVRDLKTQAEYTAAYSYSSTKTNAAEARAEAAERASDGFYYLTNKLFDTVTQILEPEEGTAVQKVIELLPSIYYFLQSDGLQVVVHNLLMFAWVLVDTIRPIVNINLDDVLHHLLSTLLGYSYDKSQAQYSATELTELILGLMSDFKPFDAAQAVKDKQYVDAIFGLSVKDLSLKALFEFAQGFTGVNMRPLTYAFEGMCEGETVYGVTYGVRKQSVTGSGKTYTAYRGAEGYYTMDYYGPDIITVTISALLDLLHYEGNAEAIDKLFGLMQELLPSEQLENMNAQGFLEALESVFAENSNNSAYTDPDWDYFLADNYYAAGLTNDSGVAVPYYDGDYEKLKLNYNISRYHSLPALEYHTDWTYDAAKNSTDLISTLLDYITVSMLATEDSEIVSLLGEGETIETFGDYVNALLEKQLLTGEMLQTIASYIAVAYNFIGDKLIATADTLLDVKLEKFTDAEGGYGYIIYGAHDVDAKDDDGNVILDGDGNPEQVSETSWYVNPDHPYWADNTAAAYVDSREEFKSAVTEMLGTVSSIISFVFLEADYRFFYVMDEASATGTTVEVNEEDAIVIDGLGAYAKGVIPVLEAILGHALDSQYAPASYYDASQSGNARYLGDKWISDMIDLLFSIVDDVKANPLAWIFDRLPGILYFINANGLGAAVKNILGAVTDIIDMVNTLLSADERLSTANIAGLDLTNLTLVGILELLESTTGLYIRDDIKQYMKYLYVGNLRAFDSANGHPAFTMDLDTNNEDSTLENRANFLTILISLVVEVITDSGQYVDPNNNYNYTSYDNAAVLDQLVPAANGLISDIITVLKNPVDPASVLIDINWDYFQEGYDLVAHTDPETRIVEVPGYAFQYLNYTTKWTYSKAATAEDAFGSLVFEVLKFIANGYEFPAEGSEEAEKNKTIIDLMHKIIDAENIGQIISTETLYTAENLNTVLHFFADFIYGEDAAMPAILFETLGSFLGATDLRDWNGTYDFVASAEGAETENIVSDGASGYLTLNYVDETVGEGEDATTVRHYVINDRRSFGVGLAKILQPAKRLLQWILFGKSYTFFMGNTSISQDDVLITIPGSNGYGDGLALILEALGIENLKSASFYADNIDLFISQLVDGVTAKLDAICADPVNAIIDLIPELIYFINAGGLQASLTGMLSGVLGLLSEAEGLVGMVGQILNISEEDMPDPEDLEDGVYSILNSTITMLLKNYAEDLPEDYEFDLRQLNLKSIFAIVEGFAKGIEITDVLGDSLDLFKIGILRSYLSHANVPGGIGYKMEFAHGSSETTNKNQFADFITILLSAVIDVLEYKPAEGDSNAKILGDLISGIDTDLVVSIVGLLNSGFEPNILPIDWLYFDDATALYTLDSDGNVVLKDNPPEITAGSLTKPDATISYLTYASDWTEETAEYVTNNLKAIVLGVLRMLNTDGGMNEIIGIVNGSLTIDDLYSADNLNAIVSFIRNIVAGDPEDDESNGLPDFVLQLLDIILDIDLSAYRNITDFGELTGTTAEKRQAFVAGINEVLQPVAPILDWLLFGEDLTYFDKDTDVTSDPGDNSDIQPLINFAGATGYVDALVPLMEALGVQMPAYVEGETKTADILYPMLNNILARVESIVADPINEVLDILPNLIYFINTNALATVINNLLAPIFALVNELSPMLFNHPAVPAEEINVNDMLTDILGLVAEKTNVELPAIVDVIVRNVNFTKLDLAAILTAVEAVLADESMENPATLKIVDVTGAEKIEKFYTHLTYAESSTGKPAFKMEGSADMVTVLVNYLLEVLLYDWGEGEDAGSNAEAIDILTGGSGMVTKIVNLIKGISDASELEIAEPIWNYFNEDQELGDGVTVPQRDFVYLDYSNSWTFEKAVAIDGQLEDLVGEILTTLGVEDVSSLLRGLIPLDTYLSADGLNAILGLLRTYLYGDDAVIDEVLLNTIGHVIGAEGISEWKGDYIFESEAAAGYAVVTDEAFDLEYYTDEAAVKHYIIEDRTDFASGLQMLLKPANKLLGWLLLGNNIAFFVKNEDGNVTDYTDPTDNGRLDNELIRIAGTEGYSTGLVLLLEALGCENLKKASEYNGDASALLKDIIVSVLNRLDVILANPIPEVLALIPELIYFINAHGLQTVVQNFAGSLLNLLNKVNESGLLDTNINVEALLSDLIKGLLGDAVDDDWTFTWDDVDLTWVIKLVEAFTDLKIEEAVGYSFKYFVLGVVYSYETKSEYFDEAYKVRYATESEHTDDSAARMRADMITILLSLVIDVLEYDDNANKVEALINKDEQVIPAGTIAAVLNILQNVTLGDMKQIDWFYFDTENSLYNEDGTLKNPAPVIDENTTVTTPIRTIHYLSYNSDWTEASADYVSTHIEDILAEVFAMLGMEETTVAGLIANVFTVDDLYKAENLNAIVDAMKSFTTTLPTALVKVAGLILGGDFSAYETMTFSEDAITDKATFIAGLCEALEPLYGLLNWLLFGEGFDFFYDNDCYNGHANERDLIGLKGAEGYAYGLVPILEALGVDLPDVTEETALRPLGEGETYADTFLYKVLSAVLTRAEEVLTDPVNEIFALLPNILYFINAGGVSAGVFNLLNAVLGLVQPVNETLQELGGITIGDTTLTSINISELVNGLLHEMVEDLPENYTFDVENIDLLAIVELIEVLTGLKIQDVVTAQKIDDFYLGQITYFKSSNGKASFRMVYSEEEGREDMITVVLNFLVEVLVYEDETGNYVNIEKIKEMFDLDADTETLIDTIVPLITGKTEVNATYTSPNWNYFNTEAALTETITVPESSFIYLAYRNDWTMARANEFDSILVDLVDNVLAIVKKDGDYTVADLIAENVDLDEMVYNAGNLNSIMELIRKYLYGPDAFIGEHLLEFAGLILGGELSEWNSTWTFADYEDGKTYVDEAETGLKYEVVDGAKVYAIAGAEDFVNALLMVLKPAERLLSWLLLGRSYEFFVDNETGNNTLIKVPGTNGYGKSLVLLLEALGVKGLKKGSEYADMHELLETVLNGIVDRVNEILADPINEALDLLPELIYFVNANGLGTVVNNLTTVLFSVIDVIGFNKIVPEAGDTTVKEYIDTFIAKTIKDLLKQYGDDEKIDALNISLDSINLQLVADVIEAVTDFRIKEVLGETYPLATFALGTATQYDSKADFAAANAENDALKTAYKMVYTPDKRGAQRADLITIVISFAIELLKNEHNQVVIEDMAGLTAGTIADVFALLTSTAYEVLDIDWFYFNPTYDYAHYTTAELITMEPSINYLSYWSNWDQNFANYLDDHLDTIITTVLNMIPATEGKTVSDILKNVLKDALNQEGDEFDINEALYTAELLNTVKDAVKDLVSKFDDVINGLVDGELQNNKIKDAVDILLDVDLTAWDSMEFTDDAITDRASFAAGLAQIVAPISSLLDWLLFGDDLALFNRGRVDDETVQDLIVVNGYEGYAYGLIPLLEALGVQPDDISDLIGTNDPDYTVNVQLPSIINAVLERAEEILDDPVNQILALIPNVLYFINANGLAASVNNLLGAVMGLVDSVNNVIADLAVTFELGGTEFNTIDLNGIVNALLPEEWDVEINVKDLRLHDVIRIIEAVTGFELDEFIAENKIEEFYLGQITPFTSANSQLAFRMEYSDGALGKDRADMITVMFNYIVEAALYGDNTAKIEEMLDLEPGTINNLLDMLANLGSGSYNYDWNYFNGEETLLGDEIISIKTPETPFNNYLTYKSDWTQNTADTLVENLPAIVDNILKMINADDETKQTVSAILKNNFNLYTAENLNKILDLVRQLTGNLDAVLLEVIDALLKTDLTYWDNLTYTDEQIRDSGTFGAALVEILTPIYSVIDWLFFGKDITLFVKDKSNHEQLIVVQGSKAYENGLAPILEALGVTLPAYDAETACAATIVPGLVNALIARIDEILNDPVEEALELLPELLYFINANGLSDAVYNMFGGIINAANTVFGMGIIDAVAGYATVEDLVIDKIGLDPKKLDLVGIFNFVENYEKDGQKLLKGLLLNDVFTRDNDGDGIEENYLENFYIGKPGTPLTKYVSTTGKTGFKLELNENRGDLLTMLLSVVLEVLLYEENEEPIVALLSGLGIDISLEDFQMLKAILVSGIALDDDALKNINWVYFLGLSGEALQSKIEEVLSLQENLLPDQPERTQNALMYGENDPAIQNLWNKDLRNYLNENLESIVDLAIAMATDGQNVNLSEFLEANVKVFSDDTANALMGYIANALSKVDDTLIDTVGALFGAEQLSALKNTKASGITTKEQFVDFFVETLSPLSTVLDFLLFGREFKLFTHLSDTEIAQLDETSEIEAAGEPAMIRLKGGEGYKYGLAPILAALGVDTEISEEKTEVALREVLTNLTNRIDEVLYGGDTINEALKLILNVIYFINADGLSVSVHNLLAPVDTLLAAVGNVIGREDLSVNSLITAVDLDNLNFDFIFSLVTNKTGIVLSDAENEEMPIGGYLKNFYFGALEYFTSYGDRGNFRMVYTEEENRIDMVTIVVTLLLDTVIYERNHDALVNLVKTLLKTDDTVKAEEYVNTIVALLLNQDYRIPMVDYKWAWAEQYGDTGIVISAANGLTGDSIFGTGLYGPLYTREMGAYISKFLPLFIDTYLVLLGVKNDSGDIYRSLEDILKKLIGDNIYTNKILRSIADAITGAVASLKENLGEEMFNHVVEVLNASLGVDLNDILYGRVATIQEGNKDQFIQAICDLLKPAGPLLRWLLTDTDIALFNHDVVVNADDTYSAGDDYIVLKGAKGYENAVVPLLEAIRAGDSTGIKTQAEYSAIEDNADLIKYILTPIFSRLDDILQDPLVEIFNELPAVVYFLNSNGLDTAFRNLLNPVYSLLNAIEPITGNVDIYDLIGIDLGTVNANTLIQLGIDAINDQTAQFDLTDVIADAVTELTLGTVDSFTSVRMLPEYLNDVHGHTAEGNAIDYTMHYSADGAGGDQVDYVTIIMRLLLKFISIPQNVTAIEAMLKGKLNDDGYKFLCSLLENFSQMAASDDGMDKIMYTVYYIFYAALNAGVATNNGLARFNGDYTFLNQLFATSSVGFLRQLEISLGDLLNKYTPEVISDHEVAPQGQISFWQKIINFFKKIGDFFRNLFSR